MNSNNRIDPKTTTTYDVDLVSYKQNEDNVVRRNDGTTYERTAVDDQIDLLIELLGDSRPARGGYSNAIYKAGFETAHAKALELRTSPTVKNPAAVFFGWQRRLPERIKFQVVPEKVYTPDLYIGKDGLQHDSISHDTVLRAEDFNLNDPLAGFDEAVGAL